MPRPQPPIHLAAHRKAPKPTQRELDQEATIDTFRKILAAIVRRHGTLDVLHVPLKDIAALKDGDMRVRDDIVPGNVTLSIRNSKDAKVPFTGPRLITR